MDNKLSPADRYIRIDNSQKYYLFKAALPEMERLNQETVEKRDAEIKEELEKTPSIFHLLLLKSSLFSYKTSPLKFHFVWRIWKH